MFKLLDVRIISFYLCKKYIDTTLYIDVSLQSAVFMFCGTK